MGDIAGHPSLDAGQPVPRHRTRARVAQPSPRHGTSLPRQSTTAPPDPALRRHRLWAVAGRGLRRWVLLAPVPRARECAKGECRILGAEARPKCRARPGDRSTAAEGWLEGRTGVGARGCRTRLAAHRAIGRRTALNHGKGRGCLYSSSAKQVQVLVVQLDGAPSAARTDKAASERRSAGAAAEGEAMFEGMRLL